MIYVPVLYLAIHIANGGQRSNWQQSYNQKSRDDGPGMHDLSWRQIWC